MDNLGTIILAVGALGTAAFGIVEALKWTGIGVFGFRQLVSVLGEPVIAALRVAYGAEAVTMLKELYRTDRKGGELPTTIRQGARVGLTPETAPALAKKVGVVSADDLAEVAKLVQSGKPLEEAQRGILGRFELALDSRIDAALALADTRYKGYVRLAASFVAIAIALIVGIIQQQPILISVIVGVAAVPFAPVAKDLASGLQAASQAMARRKK